MRFRTNPVSKNGRMALLYKHTAIFGHGSKVKNIYSVVLHLSNIHSKVAPLPIDTMKHLVRQVLTLREISRNRR